MKKVLVLNDAATDIEKGRDFYNSIDPGAGDYFARSILSDLDKLSEIYGVHPIVFGHHRMLASRFPFAIYYRTNNNQIEIVAVLDLRRNPIVNYTGLRER
ncbi:type II toxin-antitoxin system RelE/ParE family toxin [Rhodohalobacter sp.]|uniref:type II toxin-antitoxin system RelE/ParE family toxin n=1 Tax=Rhodohalobacter sp. TaxID=1974210 RepID=UPI00356AC5DE